MYCCQNWFCRPNQSTFIGLRDSYHNLASPTNVKQNLWTFTPSGNACLSIQSFIVSKCTSASSGFPENSGLKCDLFNCDQYCTCAGCCSICGTFRAWGAWTAGAGSPASAMSMLYYVMCACKVLHAYIISLFYLILLLSPRFSVACKRSID